jgi:hypothetical protein
MEKTRCSIELGNNRFVQASEWKDEIRIDVREWGDQGRKTDTHEKGDQSPPTQMGDARRQSRVFGNIISSRYVFSYVMCFRMSCVLVCHVFWYVMCFRM